MKTTLLVVGKTTDAHIEALTNDYIKRIEHYMPFEMEVIPKLKNTATLSEAQQKEQETLLIKKRLQPGDVLVLLDEHGKELRSIELANWFDRKKHAVNKRLVLLIGGPYGFHEEIYNMANEKLSLSKLTFSHQMIRMILCEQIYRAMTILNGEPYHHE
ncbi:MAG: 23S rRNA (pseudouridine(1915)-N(3))-methyltransferase RlmH [Bacteroidaceae bacterium]|nr:23S rRNA (pseudouridine(1915)-N(3))-methyltransferase RlmH [Bacteroidaceae bacterium]